MDRITLTEKVFALRDTPAFNGLYESELITIATVSGFRRYQPGEVFCEAGHLFHRVYITVKGALEAEDGQKVPSIIGAGSVLLGLPVSKRLVASPDQGAVCIFISKSHFFTISYQCPSLISGLLKMDLLEKSPTFINEGEG